MSANQETIREPAIHHKRMLWAGGVAIIILLIGAGLFFRMNADRYPLPSAVVKNASFPLYYPSPMPKTYAYQKGSGKLQNSVVFYELASGGNVVNVSEQAVPPHPPDITHLTGFKNLTTFAGNAAIGTSDNQPVAIILSDTTLITISGHRNVPNDVVSNFAKSMSSLSQ